jgi:hypothetical protein
MSYSVFQDFIKKQKIKKSKNQKIDTFCSPKSYHHHDHHHHFYPTYRSSSTQMREMPNLAVNSPLAKASTRQQDVNNRHQDVSGQGNGVNEVPKIT